MTSKKSQINRGSCPKLALSNKKNVNFQSVIFKSYPAKRNSSKNYFQACDFLYYSQTLERNA